MLKSLSVYDFRNLNLSFELSSGINIIHGDNGSGKSSILEAIHFLSFGRSFRASNASQMIAHDKDAYTIQAAISKDELENKLAIYRQETATQAKLNASKTSLVKIAALLPALFIDCDSHRNYFTSSTHRRRMFDWLLFHVEPAYMSSYRAYSRALKHRNASLKQGLPTLPWDKVMDEEAIKIHQMRFNVFEMLLIEVDSGAYELNNAKLVYTPGYDVEVGFMQALSNASMQDRKMGYTTIGPHKADWQLCINGVNAVQSMSQGQQKIAHLKLILLHYEIMRQCSVRPMIMIDDMPAELDANHKALLESFLTGLEGQIVITAINPEDVSWGGSCRLFHVKQFCLNEGKTVD